MQRAEGRNMQAECLELAKGQEKRRQDLKAQYAEQLAEINMS